MNISRVAAGPRSFNKRVRPEYFMDACIIVELNYVAFQTRSFNMTVISMGSPRSRQVSIWGGSKWLSLDESTKHPWSCLYE